MPLTQISNREVELSSGERKVLPADTSWLEVRGDRFVFSYPDRVPGFERVTMASDDRGLPIWSMARVPGTKCRLNDDGTLLSLPMGDFESARPIRTVLQKGLYFVICMNGWQSVEPSPVICLNEDGQIRWKTEPVYLSVTLGRADGIVEASRGIVMNILKVSDGSVVDSLQDK